MKLLGLEPRTYGLKVGEQLFTISRKTRLSAEKWPIPVTSIFSILCDYFSFGYPKGIPHSVQAFNLSVALQILLLGIGCNRPRAAFLPGSG